MAEVPRHPRLSGLVAAGFLAACTSAEPEGLGVDAAAAVPSGDDGGGDARAPALECPSPGGASPAAPSFADDVFPLLNEGCGRFSCHNDAFRIQGLFLGPSADEYAVDAPSREAAYASLLEMSRTAPALARVEPGDPARSFLMLKLDGCHAALDLDCPSSVPERPCGSRMPPASDPWPAAWRDVVRGWIAAGASGP